MQTETESTDTRPDTTASFLAAPSPDARILQQLETLGQEMASVSASLPEASVSEFPSPKVTVLFTPHQVSLTAARAAVAASLTEAHPQRLTGIRPDRVLETLRPVFLPRWRIKGEISGRWRADGIKSENWEVDCPHCFGSGKVGIGVQQRECPNCWGGGKEKQTRKQRHPEQGSSEAGLLDSLSNDGAGVHWPASLAAGSPAEPENILLLPEDFRTKLRCLRPAGVYPSEAMDTLKNRLAMTLEQQAKSTLAQYSRVEGFSFDPLSVRSQTAVAAWLYPAYLASVPGKQGKPGLYGLCDALTGKVLWAQGETGGEEDEGHESRNLLIRSLGVAAAVAALAGAALWYFYGRA